MKNIVHDRDLLRPQSALALGLLTERQRALSGMAPIRPALTQADILLVTNAVLNAMPFAAADYDAQIKSMGKVGCGGRDL